MGFHVDDEVTVIMGVSVQSEPLWVPAPISLHTQTGQCLQRLELALWLWSILLFNSRIQKYVICILCAAGAGKGVLVFCGMMVTGFWILFFCVHAQRCFLLHTLDQTCPIQSRQGLLWCSCQLGNMENMASATASRAVGKAASVVQTRKHHLFFYFTFAALILSFTTHTSATGRMKELKRKRKKRHKVLCNLQLSKSKSTAHWHTVQTYCTLIASTNSCTAMNFAVFLLWLTNLCLRLPFPLAYPFQDFRGQSDFIKNCRTGLECGDNEGEGCKRNWVSTPFPNSWALPITMALIIHIGARI